MRTSVIESKGEVKPERYEQNRKVMRNLWNEIADLADFNKVNKCYYCLLADYPIIDGQCILLFKNNVSNSGEPIIGTGYIVAPFLYNYQIFVYD